MVAFDVWIDVVFEHVEVNLNLDLDFNFNQQVISVASDVWNDRKAELQQADREEAMRIAKDEISRAG